MKYLFFINLLCWNIALYAQTGSIKGKITDEKGDMLIGATVIIDGTQKGTIADLDGNYKLENINAGEITLICSFLSYESAKKTITVLPDKEIQLNFTLKESSSEIEGVEITTKKNRESENILLIEQKKAVLASQSIGSQELSRKGVSDAEGAVTKISGVSKRDGLKNVFVRGLGDRYNTTTLNGFAIPSEDPEFKNVSLDLFTSDMIQSVNVNKVFSSAMHGDVGGALINIKSKELTEDKEFKVGISSGINSQVIGRSEFFLPDGINRFGYATASNGPEDKSGAQFINDYTFNTSLDPIQRNTPFNGSIAVSGGRKFLKKHSFFLVGAMNNSFEYQEGVTRLITATNAGSPFRDFDYKQYTRNASHLLMGNVEINLKKSKLQYNSVYLHTATASAMEFYGREIEIFQIAEDYNSEGHTRRLQINDNSVLINQLIYSGNLSSKIRYNIGVAVNRVIGKEPDRRILMFPSIGNGRVQMGVGEGRNQRFNSTIKETAFLPKANIQYVLSKDKEERESYLEVGYDSRISFKNFDAPIYNHYWNAGPGTTPTFSLDDLRMDPILNQEALDNGDFIFEQQFDKYDVRRNNHGVYVDWVQRIGNKFTLNAGLRTDYIFTEINYEVNRGANIGTDSINGIFLSPSLNAKYELNEKNHLRAGASRTYTLPQDKEISPFIYIGIDGNDNGNPDLEYSTNYNFDLKWDFYISRSELLSVNAFYKYILNPIARVDQGNSAMLRTFDNVSDHATAAGIELEFRKQLMSLADKHRINFGLNASYIYTRVDLDPVFFVQNTTSTLEGAAPYILNADITYNLSTKRVNMTSALVVNYLSDKVHTIGTRGFNNLIEEDITTLDFVTTLEINKRLGFNIKARNLLNPEYKLTRKAATDTDIPSVVIRSYKRGVVFDFGITYKF
jgi:hypothetical protein